jgi:molybdopterin synthase sulfur carrier subunit
VLTVLYFARLRERLGCASESIALPDGVTCVADLRDWLMKRGGEWESALGTDRSIRVAVNQDMARADTAIGDGDEIAFFPPVTGG